MKAEWAPTARKRQASKTFLTCGNSLLWLLGGVDMTWKTCRMVDDTATSVVVAKPSVSRWVVTIDKTMATALAPMTARMDGMNIAH